jgi:CRISPR/Cas system endoribonuclease Cas6 (RAMP superfamily)
MPSRWHILFPGINPTLVRREHLHALVSRWFDTAPASHHAAGKPYNVTPPAAHPTGTSIEVGLIDDTLIDQIHTHAAPGTGIRLGTQHTHLTHPPTQLAGLAWTQLATTGTANAWCLRMLTPTTFRRGNAFTPWPAPHAILGSLRKTWLRHTPPDLPHLVLDLSTDPVWVTDLNGANQVVKVNNLTVSGFVGRIRFTCDGPPTTAAAIDKLMRLAPYAGVGAHTTRGFGHVRLEPTWH